MINKPEFQIGVFRSSRGVINCCVDTRINKKGGNIK
jgi:hypothetical protein